MVSTILRGLALAMAVAVFILGILGNIEAATLISLLSVGLLALTLEGFLKRGA